MKIYTKTGDDGTTGLVGGTRVKKYNIRLESYGTIDELNSYVGYIRSLQTDSAVDKVLEIIQNKLFVIGANLATEDSIDMIKKQLPCKAADIELLEQEMDRMNESLPELRAFILPGGSQASCVCHVARTVCRRAERNIVELAENHNVDSNLIKYVNRLSDYLFVLSRYLNIAQKHVEILWEPNLNE
ncbi:MAG TPA: cob(I)yrinic acid a,c-diamide adenosyltransferase [Prolixibacteraceae bacterium]|jgi:cob(I)alamin adenosyltransferase|nr:cob(I)yrinic acid a,c-diamide adenosyltransferase [Prolixibacteraceae bacterium]HPR84675.1 cob(I)yrinic acid a,c-diamide adenosyltransferase [Prolixibacteraceae bacterium]